MKISVHVPVEQYGFAKAELDVHPGMYTPQMVADFYDDLRGVFTEAKVGEGLSSGDFDSLIQNQISGIGNHADLIPRMSTNQRKMYDINRRAISRINYKLAHKKE